MKIGYFAMTDQGFRLVHQLNEKLPGEIFPKAGFKDSIEAGWHRLDACVCVMAAGIVVRHIAPLLKGKDRDPAVIVMDSNGQWAVSLLSGHLGGANELAAKLAEISGGRPVITTATDVEGATAFDEVAKRNHLLIENLGALKYVSGGLLRNETVQVVIDPLYRREEGSRSLYLRPQTLILGVGCKKGTAPEQMRAAFQKFAKAYIPMTEALRAVATVDIKASEGAILSLGDMLEVPLMVISRNRIRSLDFEKVPGGPIESSPFVEKAIGVGSAAEASAYLAALSMSQGSHRTGRADTAAGGRLRIKKTKYEGITFALAEMVQKINI